MPVTFQIPGPLKQFTANRSTVQFDTPACASLIDALQLLFAASPGLRDRLLTESGEVRQHVNIFIGKDDIRYTGGLTSPLPPNAEILIVPSISGGAQPS